MPSGEIPVVGLGTFGSDHVSHEAAAEAVLGAANAGYLIAEEKDLVLLPAELSYADGAQVACGFGTVYEGLEKIGIRITSATFYSHN